MKKMSAGGSSRLAVARQHVRSVAPLRQSVDDEQHILIVIAVLGYCLFPSYTDVSVSVTAAANWKSPLVASMWSAICFSITAWESAMEGSSTPSSGFL